MVGGMTTTITSTLRIGTADGIHSSDGTAVALAGRAVTALVPGWALTDGDTVWRETGGGDWAEAAVLDSPWPATALLPLGATVLVGTREAHLLRLDPDGRVAPVAAFEDLPARREWYTPWGGPADVRSLAAADDIAYVNVHVGGIARSDDGGTTWAATSLDIHTDVHQVLALPGRVLAAAGDGGLLTSVDAGVTWRQDVDGLHGTYCRAVAVAGDTVLVTASTGPSTTRAAVYRRALDGGAFERCRDGLPEWFARNIDTGCLAARGSEAAFGTADGRVFTSRDAGVHWEEVATGLPGITGLALG
jgi:hypothetical protein